VDLRKTKPSEINFSGIDAVVHCAALVHQMKGAPEEEYFKINKALTVALAEAAKINGAKHFIFLSTAHVFCGGGIIHNHNLKLGPKDICKPPDPYGRSKLEAEVEILKMADHKFTVSIIRPPMVYGEGAKGNIISLTRLIENFPVLPLGFKKNKRSLVYVGNLSYFIHCLTSHPQTGIFLPQDPRALSIMEIITLLAKVRNKKILLLRIPVVIALAIHKAFPKTTVRLFGSLNLDSKSSSEALRYTPIYTTEEGFSRTFMAN